MNKLKSVGRLIYDSSRHDLIPLRREQYQEDLAHTEFERASRAFERAWATRNFEIELYWKRATYFWAFIVSAFAAHFALLASKRYEQPDRLSHVEVYFVICVGLVLSVAWTLINIGSKSWQRNWESHIDLLEDRFTGPLYKTVAFSKSYSVSKINEIVSVVFVCTWILLGVRYLVEQDLLKWHQGGSMNWFVIAATFLMAVAIVAMFCGHGRGKFRRRRYEMYRANRSQDGS